MLACRNGGFEATPFARFFRALSEVANLVDKLHDVRGDRSRGEIAVAPGLALHLRLLAAFAVRLPALLRLSLRPLQLISWGTTYLVHAPRALVPPASRELPLRRNGITRTRMTRR